MNKEAGGGGNNADWTNLCDLEEPRSEEVSPPDFSARFQAVDENKADGKQQASENRDGPKLLPFEFVALEACLEAACSCLDNEVKNNSIALLKCAEFRDRA